MKETICGFGAVISVLMFLAGSSSAAVLLSDDFSGDLSKWDLIEAGGFINGSDGHAPSGPPCAESNNGVGWFRTKQTFDYVGHALEFSADMKVDNTNARGRVSTDIELMHPQCPSRSIALMGLVGSNNGVLGNSVNCSIYYNFSGSAYQTESSNISIPSGDGWHWGKISLHSNGTVSFYLDDAATPIWTSTHAVSPDFGPGYFMMGGWGGERYDNVLITPEPAALSLLVLGGSGLLRRRK